MPLHMRVPKLRGFKNPFRVEYQIVNLARLGELFPEGGTVGVDELVGAGAVRAGQPVKVLGNGEIVGRPAGERPRVLRQREGQDRRGRWEHHRALKRACSA